MAEMLGGYGQALILAGRGDEAKSYVDEALSLSRELKNDGLVAQTLGCPGRRVLLRGKFQVRGCFLCAGACRRPLAAKSRTRILIAKAKLAKAQVQEKRTQEAISSLKQLIQQADDMGQKYVSVESSIAMAEAMMQDHDTISPRATRSRLAALGQARDATLSVRIHYLLATIDRDSGNSNEARDNYREALRLLDAMKKVPEPRNCCSARTSRPSTKRLLPAPKPARAKPSLHQVAKEIADPEMPV